MGRRADRSGAVGDPPGAGRWAGWRRAEAGQRDAVRQWVSVVQDVLDRGRLGQLEEVIDGASVCPLLIQPQDQAGRVVIDRTGVHGVSQLEEPEIRSNPIDCYGVVQRSEWRAPRVASRFPGVVPPLRPVSLDLGVKFVGVVGHLDGVEGVRRRTLIIRDLHGGFPAGGPDRPSGGLGVRSHRPVRVGLRGPAGPKATRLNQCTPGPRDMEYRSAAWGMWGLPQP